MHLDTPVIYCSAARPCECEVVIILHDWFLKSSVLLKFHYRAHLLFFILDLNHFNGMNMETLA
jgi:hypothetical protein